MYSRILQNIQRHVVLTDSEQAYFVSLLRKKSLRRRQYLLQEGDICRYENFIVQGCLRTYEVGLNGQEHVLQFGVEGWWIGDMYSFLTETPSKLNIDALENAELLQIDRASLEALYLEVPKFERFFRIIIQNAFIAGQQRLLSNLADNAEARYLDFLKRYPNIEQRVSNAQIASYLGISPETLSRIRKNLSKA